MTVDSPKFGRDAYPLVFDGVSPDAPLSTPTVEAASVTADPTNTLSMYRETKLAGSAEIVASASCDPVKVAVLGVAAAVIANYPKVPGSGDKSPAAKATAEKVQAYTAGLAKQFGLSHKDVFDAIQAMRTAIPKSRTPVE